MDRKPFLGFMNLEGSLGEGADEPWVKAPDKGILYRDYMEC